MSARTSYSHLTQAAGHALADALRRPELASGHETCVTASRDPATTDPGRPAHPPAGTAAMVAAANAHRDLSAALSHLGRALSRLPGDRGASPPRASRRHGPGPRLLRDLERVGRVCDWEAPMPAPATAARDLREAARAIRAAADLWATHTTPGGAPRSPEASRMRHPSVLGAATREWHDLLDVAGRVAAAIVRSADGHSAPEAGATDLGEAIEALRGFPAVARTDSPAFAPALRRLTGAPSWVDIGVARPGRRPIADPITAIADTVDRLHRLAWVHAERGTGSIPALANFAAIGVLLSEAALAADSHGAGDPAPLRDLGTAWAQVSARVATLRTPHPATTVLQIERAEMAAMVRRLTTAPASDSSVSALARACSDYREVAELNLRALKAAHDRGDLHVTGAALPSESLQRRPDLLIAKLEGGIVRAPEATMRQVESAYRAVIQAGVPQASDRNPPAA